MAVNILIISHEDVGTALLNAVRQTFKHLPLSVSLFGVKYDLKLEILEEKLQNLIQHIDQKEGILVLTDLYGSTPCNIAVKLLSNYQATVVAGLNLSMLIRIMNYPTLPLVELTQKAITGGKDGIINCNCGSISHD